MNSTYSWDQQHIDKLEKDKPWEKSPKFFKKINVSALAAMKMLKHALAGVHKGIANSTKPIEIMGLLLGKPQGDTIIIMDAFPLPVEGTETRVVADDTQVQTHMVNLSESLERARGEKERFIGWYHSHPFDVESYSHCFLSATDISTQLLWQRGLDPKWVAIVVDPLRSLARQEPQIGAFRCYPVEYNPPANECPDGKVETDEKKRVQRWGKSFNRYYTLELSYFMSGLGSHMLDIMSRNHLWIRVLSSCNLLEPENRQQFADRVRNMASKLDSPAALSQGGSMSAVRTATAAAGEKDDLLSKTAETAFELSTEVEQGHSSQLAKNMLFNLASVQSSTTPSFLDS